MSETDELLSVAVTHGSERYIAERVARLRAERGWSQDELARRMTASGCPLPQSAISRIEKPPAGASTPRRAISVDELLAFARVFEVSVVDLLLPPDAFAQREFLNDLRQGSVTLALAKRHQAVAEAIMGRVAERLLTDAAWKDRVADGLRSLEDSLADYPERNAFRHEQAVRAEFLRAVLARAEAGSTSAGATDG